MYKQFPLPLPPYSQMHMQRKRTEWEDTCSCLYEHTTPPTPITHTHLEESSCFSCFPMSVVQDTKTASLACENTESYFRGETCRPSARWKVYFTIYLNCYSLVPGGRFTSVVIKVIYCSLALPSYWLSWHISSINIGCLVFGVTDTQRKKTNIIPFCQYFCLFLAFSDRLY